jgi:hypothetical protein
MAKSVYVPQAGGIIDFPDEATPQQMLAYIDGTYGKPAPASPTSAEPESDGSGIASNFAYNFATGLTDIPGGISSLLYPAKESGETPGGRFSEDARTYLQETLGIDPTKERTTAQMLAGGVGSLGSFLVPGLGAAKGVGLLGAGAKLARAAGTATAAGQGVAVGTEQRAERIRGQLDSGMQISEEDQLAAQRLSGLINASEALPVGRFFTPLSVILSKVPVSKAPILEQIIKSRFTKITRAGLAEGAQEAAAGLANDLMEAGVYNPDVEIGQDILSNAGTGAFAGSLLEGVIQLAAGRKLARARQLQQDIASEGQQNARVAQQGEIARVSEDLRNYNVEGPVTISEEEVEGDRVYQIKTPAGNTFGRFSEPDSATEAVKLYQERTGAKISLAQPIKAPSAFPVKLNNKTFESIEAIQTERDNVAAQRDAVASFGTNPETVKAQAAAQGVSEAYYKSAVVQKEVEKQEAILKKLDDFLARARGEGPVTAEPAINEDTGEAEPDVNTPVDEDAGQIELPIEEPRVLEEEAAPVQTNEEVPPLRMELRPTATTEQLADLQQELFGAPKNPREMSPEELTTYEAERDKRYPPKEVPVYYDAGVSTARPKTISEVRNLPPNPREYTPEYKKAMDAVYTELKSRINSIAPGVGINLGTLIASKPGYIVRGAAEERQTPDGLKSFIDLATGYMRPGATVEEMVRDLVGTMNHEVIHVLRTKGLLRPAEWRILSKAVENAKVPGKKYTYLDKAQAIYEPMGGVYADPDAVVEEAVAEMYKDWVAGKGAPVQTRGLFNRITEFLRRIFRVLQNNRYNDVFKRIETGETGRRTPDPMGREGARFSAAPAGAPLSTNLEDRSSKAFQLYPYLRSASARYYDHKAKILSGTNPGNAARQIQNLDQLLAAHPNTLASDAAWADYVADAMGKDATIETGVPIIPYKAVQFANNPDLIVRQLGSMTPGQLDMAEDGLSAAKDFERAYRNGSATPMHTAKLILWGILSRGVSPFVQESMFLDVVNPIGVSNRTGRLAGNIDQFIQDAIEGQFDLNAYRDYVRTLKIDGLPGAGTTHNLGAFGTTTLVKLQERVPDGRTILEYLHDLIGDYNLSGKQIRRLFHEVNPGIGINNKVLSFMMLVSGRDDVMVLDRVQMRNQFNDGRFDDYNLYDGVKVEKLVTKKDGSQKLENVTDTGSGMAKLGDGVRGLMYYEALERDLTPAVREAYNRLNRGNQFSMGRYHWESWVATSAQEVDHGSVSGLIKDALGELDPYTTISTGEGKYDTFNSGIKYGYTPQGEPVIGLPDGLGRYYNFTPEYAKKVIAGYDKRSTGIIRDANFRVSTSTEGPWYDRPEVNKDRLRSYLQQKSDEFRAERGRTLRKGVQEAGPNNANRPGPGPVHAVRRRGGLRQPPVTNPREVADKPAPREGARFSAAPALNSDEFKRWFRKSKVVNPDGTPKVLYHGTNARVRFTTFDTVGSELGSHFGTQKQSAKFVTIEGEDSVEYRQGGRIYPVYLSLQNPLRLRDMGNWDNDKVASQLFDLGMIDRATFEAMIPDYGRGRGDFVAKERENREMLQRIIRTAGYDGIVYLNRFEGLNSDPEQTVLEGFNDDRELNQLTDSEFRSYLSEAEDSYIVFAPTQVKSIFNEFNPGEARRLRFSAAPLPSYIESKNDTLFAPAPKMSFAKMAFEFLFGARPMAKTLHTMYGDIDLSSPKMMRLMARGAAVDSTAFVAELEKLANEKLTGNYERELADTSATVALAMHRRSSHLNASMLMRGKLELDFSRPGDIQSATVKAVDDPDSMVNILKILMEPGPVDSRTQEAKDKREVFKSYATAIRARNKAAAGLQTPGEVDATYINTIIPFTQQNYPEVVRAYEMYQRFNRNLLKTAVQAGLMDQRTYNNLIQNMDYYGFYREVYETPVAPSISTKTASEFKLRAFKGSDHGNLMNDPVYVMIHNAQFWVSAITRNIAAQKAFKLSRDMGVARILASDEKPDPARDEEDQVMFFRENGIQKRFAVSDPLLVAAIGADDRTDIGRFWQLVGMPTTILRETVTRDPAFMVANLMRDTLSAWITSGEDFTPVIGTVKGFAKAYKNGASYQALMGRGIVGSYDLAMLGPQELASKLRNRAMPQNVLTVNGLAGGKAVVGGLWNRLGALSEYSDAATRIAVYEAARAKGLSEAEAAFRAIEILDFSRRGGSQAISILTKMIPFLNARIQGMDVLYQAGKAGVKVLTGRAQGDRERNIGKKFLVRGALLAAISVALEIMNEDDEDYQQLDDYIKNSNMLVPLSAFGLKGQFLAYPKPFEAGLLFSTFPQQIYKATQGNASGRDTAKLFFESMASTFGVNPIPQAILPLMEITTNHDFYTGLPLISEGKARLAPELQYNSSTSQLAMMIGKIPIWYDMTSGRFEGASPIVIDNLISGYGGPVGSYLAQAVGLAMEGANIGPERLPRDLTQLPVVKRFMIDSEVKNPKAVTQAYELFRIVDEANRSFSRLRQTGDAEATLDYLNENRDVLSYKKYVFKLVDRLNKLSAHERAIERDTTMSDDEKREAMRKLREVRIRLASKVKEINEKLGR